VVREAETIGVALLIDRAVAANPEDDDSDERNEAQAREQAKDNSKHASHLPFDAGDPIQFAHIQGRCRPRAEAVVDALNFSVPLRLGGNKSQRCRSTSR